MLTEALGIDLRRPPSDSVPAGKEPVKTLMPCTAVQAYCGVIGMWGVKTDHWFYALFQRIPDLIALLLPEGTSASPTLGPDASGDALYRFRSLPPISSQVVRFA